MSSFRDQAVHVDKDLKDSESWKITEARAQMLRNFEISQKDKLQNDNRVRSGKRSKVQGFVG
jgi:hypothetical protein